MKQPFDIFTVFEIQQSFKTANNFFNRFETVNPSPLYTLADLGQLNNISPALLSTILLKFEKESNSEHEYYTLDFDCFSITELLHYVEITHQFYRKERMKRLERIIFNLEKEVGGFNAFTDLLYQSYVEFRQALFHHLQQEEEILFPYTKSLLDFSNGIFKEEYPFLKSKLPECFFTHPQQRNRF